MNSNKVKSFTLSELLIVMIITVIIVGIAFSVLNLVKKEIVVIEKNYRKTTNLLLFEERLWLDFNNYPKIEFSSNENKLFLKSETDTILYQFYDDYVMRNQDTIKSKLDIDKIYFQGNQTKQGEIDAISILGVKELPDYTIFVFKQNDATFFMNNHGI